MIARIYLNNGQMGEYTLRPKEGVTRWDIADTIIGNDTRGEVFAVVIDGEVHIPGRNGDETQH